MIACSKNAQNVCIYWEYNYYWITKDNSLRNLMPIFLNRNLLQSELDYFTSVFVLKEYAFPVLNILSVCCE